MTLKSHYKVRLLNVSKSKCCFKDIITFGVNKYFNGNVDKLYSESLDFQEELHARMIKYLMHLRDTSRPEDELDVSKAFLLRSISNGHYL